MLALFIYATAVAAASATGLREFKNLVTFGDSYTDEGRLNYIFSHNALPPSGQLLPIIDTQTSVGGYVWPRLVAQKTGVLSANYAVGGAMISDNVTTHFLSNINGPFPSIVDQQIPQFKTDLGYPGLFKGLRSDNTLYAFWIGTNDLGSDGFLTEKEVPGAVIPDYTAAMWRAFDMVYKLGGRNFVLLNVLPLQLTPMYSSIPNGGTGNNSYWGDKTLFNTTETQFKMQEYVETANTMFATGAPFYLIAKRRWPGATITIFDTHSLVLDLRADPSKYYTAPANVTWSWKGSNNGVGYESSDPETSFMWYDELHPSEQTCTYIAEEFVNLVSGKSKYATYYRG